MVYYSTANCPLNASTEDNANYETTNTSGGTSETRIQMSEAGDEEEAGPITEEDIAALSSSERPPPANETKENRVEEEEDTTQETDEVPVDTAGGTITLSSSDNGELQQGNNNWSSPEFKIAKPAPPLRKASITPTTALIAASRMAAAPATRGVLFDQQWQDAAEDSNSNRSGRKKKSSNGRAPFWERLTARGNRVAANANGGDLSTSDEEYGRRRMRDTKTGKAVRHMRKMVSVSSKNKSKTSQEDLAMAVVGGNLLKTEQIVDAYVALYRKEGFNTILGFK